MLMKDWKQIWCYGGFFFFPPWRENICECEHNFWFGELLHHFFFITQISFLSKLGFCISNVLAIISFRKSISGKVTQASCYCFQFLCLAMIIALPLNWPLLSKPLESKRIKVIMWSISGPDFHVNFPPSCTTSINTSGAQVHPFMATLEQRTQHSSGITYPRQTTSTMHKWLQKHDKVIKAAIWSRPPHFPDPQTMRAFRGWDGAGEPIPTPGDWAPTSEMLNICCQHPVCLRTCSSVPRRRPDRSEQFLAARQRHYSHRCVCDLWPFDTASGEMANCNSNPCKLL